MPFINKNASVYIYKQMHRCTSQTHALNGSIHLNLRNLLIVEVDICIYELNSMLASFMQSFITMHLQLFSAPENNISKTFFDIILANDWCFYKTNMHRGDNTINTPLFLNQNTVHCIYMLTAQCIKQYKTHRLFP